MPQGQRCDRREVNIQCLDVDDPQLMIMLHFMTPFMSVQPVFESPLARPAALQRTMASQLLSDLLRERPGAHGMLLVSIEQDGGSDRRFLSVETLKNTFLAPHIIGRATTTLNIVKTLKTLKILRISYAVCKGILESGIK